MAITRDWANLTPITAAGGEESIRWTDISPAVVSVTVYRNGAEQDPTTVTVSGDRTTVTLTPPAGEMPIAEGERFWGRYLWESSTAGALRDWRPLQAQVLIGGETAITWALTTRVAYDGMDLTTVLLNGQEVLPSHLSWSDDGLTLTYTPDAGEYPEGLPAGSIWGRYLYQPVFGVAPVETVTTLANDAIGLVRGPEGLSVVSGVLSDSQVYAACEGAYYALRHGYTIPNTATVSGTDTDENGSDRYHLIRAIGFTACASLLYGAMFGRSGGVKSVKADDGSIEYLRAQDGPQATDFLAKAAREVSHISTVAAVKSAQAALFSVFGVAGPSRKRESLNAGRAGWDLVAADLLRTANVYGVS